MIIDFLKLFLGFIAPFHKTQTFIAKSLPLNFEVYWLGLAKLLNNKRK